MTRDAVAEVDSPRESCGNSVSIVGKACEKATDASHRDAKSEGDGVEIAGGLMEPDVALHELDGEEAEDESADDGFSSCKVRGVLEVMPGELRVFDPEEEFGTESGSGNGGGDNGPSDWRGERIAKAVAQ